MRRLLIHIALLTPLVLLQTGCSSKKLVPEEPEEMIAVDLGLPSGVKWGIKNLGARNRHQFGGRFTLDLTKLEDGILAQEADPATDNLGEEWRLPTQWDFEELLKYCKWERAKDSDGYLVTSAINSNSIFLPVIRYPGLLFGHDDETMYLSSCSNSNDFLTVFNLISRGFDSMRNYSGYLRPVKAGRAKVEGLTVTNIPSSLPVGSNFVPDIEITPPDALNKRIVWKTGDKEIIDVDSEERLFALYPGSVEITALSPSSGISTTFSLTVDDFKKPEAVDLGLPSGTKWASDDLGAYRDGQTGLRFAWGETRSKLKFEQNDYENKHLEQGSNYMKPEDDAATVLLGEEWRIPAPSDFSELAENCSITYMNDGAREGALFTSRINGNSIFISSNSFRLWTSAVYWPAMSQVFCLTNSGQNGMEWTFISKGRSSGYPIRPVYGGTRPTEFTFRVIQEELTVFINEIVDAPIETNAGDAKNITWFSSHDDVVGVDQNGKLYGLYFGSSKITAQASNGCSVSFKVNVPGHNGMVPIDMSLPSRKKWASCNVGAGVDEELGYYLAFGETAPKDSYTAATYSGGSADPVTALLGPHWRMPTAEEYTELLTTLGTTMMHIKGSRAGLGYESSYFWWIRVGRTFDLVLPAGGYMDGDQLVDPERLYYWCKSPDSDAPVYFVHDKQNNNNFVLDEITPSNSPHLGMLVRPIWVD